MNLSDRKKINNICVFCVAIMMPIMAQAQSSENETQHPKNLYWGDTHLHTKYSTDAYFNENKLDAESAYRFARGEEVVTSKGLRARLRRPLDFLVVADHGANLGVLSSLSEGSPLLLKDKRGKATYDMYRKEREANGRDNYYPDWFGDLFVDDKYVGMDFKKSIWAQVNDNAEKYNDPGRFTAFIGYEWTATSEKFTTGHLHRVVIFKDGKDKAGKVIPFTRIDSNKPEDLWAYMADYEKNTGGNILAIPHNGNLSQGQLFALKDSNDQDLSKDYAKTRSLWEPLFEVTQIKGDSETHPVLSPTDEFADYETWSGARYSDYYGEAGNWMRPYEYARSGLKLGLGQQAKLGVNPFKFGLIGSTDSHTSLSTADNDNFWGKNVVNGPAYPQRMLKPRYPSSPPDKIEQGWKLNASGYAAVWATENTRDALFNAMKRKETYATTGPRMSVRFFGGWEFSLEDAFKPNLADIGYAKGVPMGGDLTNAAKKQAPSFLIQAIKDPDGANLDRVQVVKGWRDKQGELHEKVFNVALSDGRKEDKKGKVPSVGNTVDVANAAYTNNIGDPELVTVWRDPEFNEDELAFYYVRVLEIPTPRWTAYDAKYFEVRHEVAGMSCLTQTKEQKKEDCIPMVTQERAYTSPIWYTPEGG